MLLQIAIPQGITANEMRDATLRLLEEKQAEAFKAIAASARVIANAVFTSPNDVILGDWETMSDALADAIRQTKNAAGNALAYRDALSDSTLISQPR